jgi:hypothetical protein
MVASAAMLIMAIGGGTADGHMTGHRLIINALLIYC